MVGRVESIGLGAILLIFRLETHRSLNLSGDPLGLRSETHTITRVLNYGLSLLIDFTKLKLFSQVQQQQLVDPECFGAG